MKLLVVLAASLAVTSVEAAGPRFVQDEVLVRFRPGVSFRNLQTHLNPSFYRIIRPISPHLNLYLVKLRPGLSAVGAVQNLKALPSVLYAQPDHIVTLRQGRA